MARDRGIWVLGVIALLPLVYSLRLAEKSADDAVVEERIAALPRAGGMVLLSGGAFLMGAERPAPDDQRPVHRVRLEPFWLDATPVTNREFARFVAATEYVTTAEERGWSLLLVREQGSWVKSPGVNWRHPVGPESSLAGREELPVVHVSWFDAAAYAEWARKRLPSESEYEFAARGGLNDPRYPWGRKLTPDGRLLANYWQGKFPQIDLGLDGYRGVSPVRAFPPSPYGLYDIAGNVACWCADWYSADAYAGSRAALGVGSAAGSERVHRGGSWYSPPEKGGGIHITDRCHAPPTETSSYLGFRCARDQE